MKGIDQPIACSKGNKKLDTSNTPLIHLKKALWAKIPSFASIAPENVNFNWNA